MPTSGMPWIKLYTEFLDDPKVGFVDELSQLLLVKLFLLAGECDCEGYLANGSDLLSKQHLAWRLRMPAEDFARRWTALEEAGFVAEEEDGTLLVVNFQERQGRTQSEKRIRWRFRKENQRSGVRDAVLQRAGERCEYCGADLGETWIIDHIVPPEQEGTNELCNLAAACRSCNTRKGGQNPDEAGMAWPRRCDDQDVTTLSQGGHSVVTGASHAERREEKRREEERRGEEDPESGADAPDARPPPTTFTDWQLLLKESDNKIAVVRRMAELLYPGLDPPSYSYIGKVARKVGGVGRLADLLWQHSTRPPTGDLLAYIQAVAKGNQKPEDRTSKEARRRYASEYTVPISGEEGESENTGTTG